MASPMRMRWSMATPPQHRQHPSTTVQTPPPTNNCLCPLWHTVETPNTLVGTPSVSRRRWCWCWTGCHGDGRWHGLDGLYVVGRVQPLATALQDPPTPSLVVLVLDLQELLAWNGGAVPTRVKGQRSKVKVYRLMECLVGQLRWFSTRNSEDKHEANRKLTQTLHAVSTLQIEKTARNSVANWV